MISKGVLKDVLINHANGNRLRNTMTTVVMLKIVLFILLKSPPFNSPLSKGGHRRVITLWALAALNIFLK